MLRIGLVPVHSRAGIMNAVFAATRSLLASLDPLPYRERSASTSGEVTRHTDGIAAAARDPHPSLRLALRS
jgi:hypothetical protein